MPIVLLITPTLWALNPYQVHLATTFEFHTPPMEDCSILAVNLLYGEYGF